MNELQIIELYNQRLLTTEQIAEFYEAATDQIKQNYGRNKEKFIEGKHFYLLEGEELKVFKSQVTNSHLPISKFASQLYLWTKQGASRHSKMLGTDKAWDMFDVLEENYFNPKQDVDTSTLSPELQMFDLLAKALAKQEMATNQLDTKMDSITDIISLNTLDWRNSANSLINQVVRIQGGGGAHRTVRSDIYKELERRAGANLSQRVTNKRRRMADEGICKSKRDKLNQVDAISDDRKLIEIYMSIVKDFAIKHGVWKDEF